MNKVLSREEVKQIKPGMPYLHEGLNRRQRRDGYVRMQHPEVPGKELVVLGDNAGTHRNKVRQVIVSVVKDSFGRIADRIKMVVFHKKSSNQPRQYLGVKPRGIRNN